MRLPAAGLGANDTPHRNARRTQHRNALAISDVTTHGHLPAPGGPL